MRQSFALRSQDRFNNFDALRLLLATAVLFSHCFVVGGGADPLRGLSGGRLDFGILAVNGFFAISGFLIALSWLRAPQPGPFLWKRTLRIYPGFLAACLLCLLVAAPLSGGAGPFAADRLEQLERLYLLLTLDPPRADGAFAALPVPVLNGSLWTIRYEFWCYLLVAAVGLTFGYRRRWVVALLFALAWLGYATQGRLWSVSETLTLPLLGQPFHWPRFLSYFLAGMTLAAYRDTIPFSRLLLLACLAGIGMTFLLGGLIVALPLLGSYVLLYAALSPRLPLQHAGRFGDFSYGVYLYGWPVQQLLLLWLGERGGAWGPLGLFAISLPVTFALALLSWHVVERPCLGRKRSGPKPIVPKKQQVDPLPCAIAAEVRSEAEFA